MEEWKNGREGGQREREREREEERKKEKKAGTHADINHETKL